MVFDILVYLCKRGTVKRQPSLSSLVEVMGLHLLMWFPSRDARVTASVSRAHWLEHNLSIKGWCPFRVNMLRTDLGISKLYYATIMPHPDPDREHSRCSMPVCVAHNLKDESSYIQQHRRSLCPCGNSTCLHQSEQCSYTIASKQNGLAASVSEIVHRGRIPFISIENRMDWLKFKVRTFQEGIKFTAISHVWSSGKGKPWADELPCCQAEHLRSCAARVLKSSGI